MFLKLQISGQVKACKRAAQVIVTTTFLVMTTLWGCNGANAQTGLEAASTVSVQLSDPKLNVNVSPDINAQSNKGAAIVNRAIDPYKPKAQPIKEAISR